MGRNILLSCYSVILLLLLLLCMCVCIGAEIGMSATGVDAETGMGAAREIKRDITKIVITIGYYSALSGNVHPYIQRICSNKTDR